MTGPSPDRFQRALTSFKRSLSTRSPDLLNQFSFSTIQDLQTACHDMQTEMGQNGRLRRMRRLQGFIEAMEQLGQSIEVFVNANDLVCFIWIAKTHVESFDKLLDAYEEIGLRIPGLMAYRSMFERHPPLATVLEDYYSDILRFHEAALKVFIRPTWKKLVKAAWKTFDTEFQPLLQSLANRRDLLESEKGSASLYEISKAREEMAARHEAKKQELRQDEIEKRKWHLLQIKNQLEAADYQQDQEMASEARDETDSGNWVLQSPAFKHWANKTATRHSVLYVHGIPGAGKEYVVILRGQCAVFDADNFKDGLDEAASGEAAKSLTWLLSLVNGRIREPTTSVRVLCSGQRDGSLDSLLSDQPAIALESSSGHSTDILKYCEHMSAKIRQHLDIASTKEDEIISKVSSRANDTFPQGIDQAYERVAIRILKESPPSAHQYASKILGWVTCAARPLRWREIQSIFCIDSESNTMDYEDKRLRVSCKQLCGSLVDVHQVLYGQPGPDDIVTIVHGSAREYLIQKHWINSVLEHAKAAMFCFRYLTSKPFRASTESISLHIKEGYYGFQDYAIQHCLDHFESCTGLESHQDILEQTMESAREFLATYSLPIPENLAALSHNDIADFFRQLPKDKRERANRFTIEYRTLDIRTAIEQIRVQDLSPEAKALISNVYGKEVRYKCPKIWCDYFLMGFDKNEDRQTHVHSHDRPFRCPEGGCFAFQLGYSSMNELENHTKTYHSPVGDEPRFPKAIRPRDDTLVKAAGRNDFAAMLACLESGIAVEVYRACELAQPDTVRVLLESSHFRSRGIEEWKQDAELWISQACGDSMNNPNNITIVKYLLEKGFSDSFIAGVLFDVEERGGDYLKSLLQPMIDLHASSDEQTRARAKLLAHKQRGRSNHALQDYQMQLKFLDQQNKTRLMMERQEADQDLS
ncbi:hypothetical protein J7T55_012304 [Diaporthe amygdali]|uniref:uncharacterized protein n=1 Tax=Phomopsis amygdali TaxID=1214568 RepID=UPI0022FDED84|nr:uncharacterized protein J7T55_012304 [Diaporthe amygdali]KAJ0123834.1 hypothetical protein J7T55_012304 [Diaporthe amygdali]